MFSGEGWQPRQCPRLDWPSSRALHFIRPARPARRPRQLPGRLALHATGTPVLLGALGSSFNYDFSEAPNGSVYYSSGRTVFVVHGTSAPVVVLHAKRARVRGRREQNRVVRRRRPDGHGIPAVKRHGRATLRHWLAHHANKPTSAGLFAVGSTVWAWTDWATDDERTRACQCQQIQDLVRDGASRWAPTMLFPARHGRQLGWPLLPAMIGRRAASRTSGRPARYTGSSTSTLRLRLHWLAAA